MKLLVIAFVQFFFSFAHLALAESTLQIYPSHPRLFFRDAAWGDGGLTLETLRARAADPLLADALVQLNGTLPNLALRAVILRDGEAEKRALSMLQQPIDFGDVTTDDGVEIAWRSMAFDWLHSSPSFSGPEKERAAEEIAKGARTLIRHLSAGDHIFHTRMYGYATGVALAGLALHGHHREAEDLIRFGSNYYRDRLFPARQIQDGTVHNGFGYGRKYTMWLTGHFISAWLSATGENLWQQIRKEEGDWAYKEVLFNIYGRYPDGSFLRFGDAYSLLSDHYSVRAVLERAAAYRDPVGYGFVRYLLLPEQQVARSAAPVGSENEPQAVDRQTAYNFFLFYDPAAAEAPFDSLPTKALFSPAGTGVAIWKSGWQDEDTTVFFKCGNYFGDHGHFDQGHLDIFRRAPLLIDSGSYLTFSGDFRMDYWRRTVAHNSILIIDPDQPDEGGQRVFHSQDDSSPEEYENNAQAETGEIVNYHVEKDLAYIAGDFSTAYSRDRVVRATRELVFLDDRFLLVRDRVIPARKEFRPRVLWHCPVLPEVVAARGQFEVKREGARALVTVLTPADAEMVWVEGFQSAGRRIEAKGHLRGLRDSGVGRVEVVAPPSEQHEFLHVIDISDVGVAEVEVSILNGEENAEIKIGRRKLILSADYMPPMLVGSPN